MRKFLICLFLLAGFAVAQRDSQHSVKLSWLDPLNPEGTTYTVHRTPGLCSGTANYDKIADGVTGLTYTDSTVQPGNYCYVVTAVLNGMESAPSNAASASVPAFPPQNLSVEVQ